MFGLLMPLMSPPLAPLSTEAEVLDEANAERKDWIILIDWGWVCVFEKSTVSTTLLSGALFV